MADTNTDYVVELIVDSIINSMKSQFEGKVPVTAFDTVRSGAVLTASNAIPFPLRLAINAIPKSAYKAAGDAGVSGIKTVTSTETVSVATNVTVGGAKALGTAVTGFFKGKNAGSLTNSTCEEQS